MSFHTKNIPPIYVACAVMAVVARCTKCLGQRHTGNKSGCHRQLAQPQCIGLAQLLQGKLQTDLHLSVEFDETP